MEKQKAPSRHSLYKDLFGDDLAVIAEAYGSNWASKEQQDLAAQLLEGRKSVHSLSTPELELLDDLAIRFNDHGGEVHETVRPEHQRLSVSDDDAVTGEEDQEVQSPGGSDLLDDDSPEFAGAYGWLSGDGEEGSGK